MTCWLCSFDFRAAGQGKLLRCSEHGSTRVQSSCRPPWTHLVGEISPTPPKESGASHCSILCLHLWTAPSPRVVGPAGPAERMCLHRMGKVPLGALGVRAGYPPPQPLITSPATPTTTTTASTPATQRIPITHTAPTVPIWFSGVGTQQPQSRRGCW